MSLHRRTYTIAVSAICGLLQLWTLPTLAESNDVESNAEWRAWPDVCRARYVAYHHELHEPMDPAWERTVSQASITKWAGIIGQPMWNDVHHYCRGLVRLHRYKSLSKASSKNYEMWREYNAKIAISEFNYTLKDKQYNPQFAAIMQASLAFAQHYSGDSRAAMLTVSEAIGNQPTIVDPYSAGYLILRELDRHDEALEILQKCFENTSGKSAENNYFLALEYLSRKDYDKAREYGQNAYKLGYPLQGVKKRLQALSKW